MLLQKSQQAVVKCKPLGNASSESCLRTVFLSHL